MFKLLIVLYILIFQNVFCEKKEIVCPKLCKCEIIENLKRANCSNQKLAMIEESDIPKQSEILDLSFNQISNLNDHVFFDMNLVSLKLLNLSHNRISQIHMNAFNGLTELKTLNMSTNSLQYILPQWFWDMSNLKELYLANNNLGSLSTGPLIESNSLKILDISMCKIPSLHNDVFIKLPNLEILDISGNSLIQLQVSTIKILPNLHTLRLLNNTWKCNDIMRELGDYCTKKGISYRDPCPRYKKVNTNQFERMINLEPQTTYEKNSWIFDAVDVNNTIIKTIEVCPNITKAQSGLLMEIIEMSPVLTLLIPFGIGILFGLIIACSIQIKPSKTKSSKKNKPFRRNSIIRSRRNLNDHYDLPLIAHCSPYGETTPVPQRKSFDSFKT